MKLVIDKNLLNESIQHVSKAVSSRTTIPILSGIKIDANQAGVTLTASDTEISIQSFIPKEVDHTQMIDVQVEGSVVIPAKLFVEMIKKLPRPQVEIEVNENFYTMIRSGSSEIQMVGMDPEEYPLLPQVEEQNTITIEGNLLKSMIKQTVFSVSTNEATPILTGVLWTLENGRLKFVATDRHRLASREASIQCDPGIRFQNVVIAGKTLNELSKIIPDQNTMIDIIVADNQVLFKMDSILFYSRILDGMYPDTTKIIPTNYKSEMVVETKALTDAIDRAYLLSREEKTNIVKLAMLDEETVEISSSSSELGKVTEQITLKSLEGDSIRISFNSKYMLDVLKVIDNDAIYIGFTGPMSPMIIKPHENPNILHLILPYRTN